MDLNPTAVELAKVSLWLDCFTLGAPLNFLDHHLRCGNSLIGATFEDLEQAVSGQREESGKRQQRMFSLNYEPLLRAINHVLQVSRLADATAADVVESMSQYDTARQALTGYRVILDLLVAKHFGFPDAPSVVEQGDKIDLTSRDRFLRSLHDDDERKLVRQVELVARQRDRRFFHWEIEFPEIFFGVVGASGQQIKHKDQIEEGSAGFDCVVGNPPYDVMEKERGGEGDPHKTTTAFIRQYQLYAVCLGGKLNLYRPFIVRSLSLLRSKGCYSQIVPMSLLGDISLSTTRKYILSNASAQRFLVFPQKDDPNNRIFREAKLSTCVPVIGAHNDNREHTFQIHIFPGKSLDDESISASITPNTIRVIDNETMPIPLCGQEELALAEKIHASSRRLRDIATITRGEINQTTFKRYITPDSSHRPLLKGVEVRMFGFNDDLSQGERQYFDERRFERDGRTKRPPPMRIATQRITGVDERIRLICAIADNSAYFADSTNSIVPHAGTEMLFLLGMLNSTLLNWRFDLTSTNNNVGTNELEALPFPREVDRRTAGRVVHLVETLITKKNVGSTSAIVSSEEYRQLNAEIFRLFSLTRDEIDVICARK